MFNRGDKISFYGKDSRFEGYFISEIVKLPLNYKGEPHLNQPVRCIVQQRGTGILLIKGEPTIENAGWLG